MADQEGCGCLPWRVLVKVQLLTGEEQWLLVHLEIQSSHEEGFASRISLYNAGIYWLCQRRVRTLVVLADLRRGWMPDEDVFRVGPFESRLTGRTTEFAFRPPCHGERSAAAKRPGNASARRRPRR